MRQPCDYRYDASDPFGSMAGGRKYPHTGSDWPAPTGSNAYAISDCVVTATGWHNGNGNYVAVRLLDGSYWSYIHLSKILCNVGQSLAEGAILALTGNTGTNSRGPHLHCSHSDSPQVYVGLGHLTDPWEYLKAHPDNIVTGDIDMRVIFSDPAQGGDGSFALIGEFSYQPIANMDLVTMLTKTFGAYAALSKAEYLENINWVNARRASAPASGGSATVDVKAISKQVLDDAAARLKA